MAQVGDEGATAKALGAGLGLFGTFIGALAFAFLLSRLVGGMYVTFLMPVIAGMLLAAFGSYGPRRFRFGDKRALVLMMIGGALVAWLGQHLLAYLRVVELVAADAGGGEGTAERGLSLIEQATGGSGFFAYLAYVSHGPGAVYSPVGMLGRMELGVVGSVLVAVFELALFAATASWSILYRTRSVRQGEGGPLARFDAATAKQVEAALAARRLDDIAALVAQARGWRTHALMMLEGESAVELALVELDALGRPARQVLARLVPPPAAHALRKALGEIARRTPDDGGPDAA